MLCSVSPPSHTLHFEAASAALPTSAQDVPKAWPWMHESQNDTHTHNFVYMPQVGPPAVAVGRAMAEARDARSGGLVVVQLPLSQGRGAVSTVGGKLVTTISKKYQCPGEHTSIGWSHAHGRHPASRLNC